MSNSRFSTLGRASLAALVLAHGVLQSAVTRADPASPAQDKPAIADVVRLKDGGVYRGTITELVPDDHVTLLTASGGTRDFKMSDVTYAGPLSKDPDSEGDQPSSPERRRASGASEGSAGGIAVHFTANLPHVQLLWRVGQSEFSGGGYAAGEALVMFGSSQEYRVLCTAPCDASLPPGEHRLALSYDGGKSVEFLDPVRVKSPMTLKGTYDSNAGLRGVGVGVILLGGLGGTLLMLAAIHGSGGPPDTGLLLAGGGVSITGVLVGLGLAFMQDSATFEVAHRDAAGSTERTPAKKETAWFAPRLAADGFRLLF